MAATAELSLTLDPMGNSLKKFFHLELLAQLGPNFLEMVFRWSSFRILSDDPAHQPRWPPQGILVSDWLIYKKSSPVKPLGQMDLYLVWSIYGMCFMKFLHSIPIGHKTWLPWPILVSEWDEMRKFHKTHSIDAPYQI